MTFGPGKYDDLATYVAQQTGIADKGGGVLVIVVGGNQGSGFSCQADLPTLAIVPEMLDNISEQLKQDRNRL